GTEILSGLLVANEKRFSDPSKSMTNATAIKRNLIFLGRYVDYKRPLMLVQAFLQLKQNDRLNGWSLSFYGDGPLRQELIARTEEHSEIVINGFRSPKNLKQVFEEAGAFCLPSKNEHWGVVVHEATMCGLPVILSDTCGAASKLLIHGYNGFGFKTDSHSDLTMALDQIFHLPAEELRRMSRNSRKMSGSLTQERWAAALMSVL
ncbi:MAG: glycosyltransferase, partial [Saprospiraceae bacterium]|nr:glycosyltransferase [Saprospiraceae bacterium]